MPNELVVSDELKQFVEEVLAKNNISLKSKIEYGSGSEIGDGYISKTFAVVVTDEEKSLHLFLKTPLGLT
ncbi:hypothetical protein QE152_g26968 [Popillia japonica]|uniref:Uncharacterized protein n=1 Tax=Popillia japonica TaxID=7064 RepID=A0AAW1JWB2_POPJA